MSERKHTDLWNELVDEAGKEEIDRAATVSVAQAEAELEAAGFDVAAERAKASAFLDALGTETSRPNSSPTAVSSPTAKEAAPHPTEETAPSPTTEAPRRKRPRARVVWLAAAASLAAVGGTLYVTLQPEIVGSPPPAPTPSAIHDGRAVGGGPRGRHGVAGHGGDGLRCQAVERLPREARRRPRHRPRGRQRPGDKDPSRQGAGGKPRRRMMTRQHANSRVVAA